MALTRTTRRKSECPNRVKGCPACWTVGSSALTPAPEGKVSPAQSGSGPVAVTGYETSGLCQNVIECTALAVRRSAVRRWITERRSIP